MKIAVIGGVVSTKILVQKLHKYPNFTVKIWGYEPPDASLVSGWTNLADLSKELDYDYQAFVRVDECLPNMQQFAPDIIFAVGLSQLIPNSIIATAKRGCVGFHPTRLPKGRGRAPIAWIVLDNAPAAATFFIIGEGVDDGQILAQEPFSVDASDDAATVEIKLLQAEGNALDLLLPRLAMGYFDGVEQDHAQASWYGRRTPEDGVIDWHARACDIARLVRASTRPHPGAFSYCDDSAVTVWKASVDMRMEKGVTGRILRVETDNVFVVQCGQGLLRVQHWQAENNWLPRVGQLLGYRSDPEIHRLRAQVRRLTERIVALEETCHRRHNSAS